MAKKRTDSTPKAPRPYRGWQIVAALVVVVAAVAAHLVLESTYRPTSVPPSVEGQSVRVQFEIAGAVEEPLGREITDLDKSRFDEIVAKSSLYDGRNGAELQKWSQVVKANATSDGVLMLLQAPPRKKASMRHFMWPPVKVGHRVNLTDVNSHRQPLMLETLNVDPPVFRVHNFLSEDETSKIIARATSADNPYSVRRSTTGHVSWTEQKTEEEVKKAQSDTRTSENGFDIDSPTAKEVKARAWQLLRLSGDYDETLADGLQVLRYQTEQAYISHPDYFDKHTSTDHNWDPTKGGTNRMATLLLYLSDVEEGGQTVFPAVPNPEPSEVPTVADQLFDKSTWQHKMIQQCYSSLAITPEKGSAILFYSQLANGQLDSRSMHGACPVLTGTKWAANLWFWNQCRYTLCQDKHRAIGVRVSR